jgi:hypothetical protein
MRKPVVKRKKKFLTFEESRQEWSSGLLVTRPLDPVARLEFDAMAACIITIPH